MSDKPEVDTHAKRRYLEQLRATIAHLARDHYPYRARRLGQQGTVTLRFILDAKGQIHNLSLLSSSGYHLLDNAAREIIEEQMRLQFQPFPPGLNLPRLEVTIPIRYQLR